MTDSLPRDAEDRVRVLGLDVPDYSDPPYGGRFGTVKAFHRCDRLVLLGGITGESRDGTVLNRGRLGDELTVEQGIQAARFAAINVLGMLRLALGTLDEVAAIPRFIAFIAATSEFDQHHLVGEAVSELFVEAFGSTAGVSGRGSIGVTSLSSGNCVELWVTAESRRPL